MYVTYCYRRSSVVCLFVCHDREPWKAADAVLVLTRVGPRNHVLDGGPDSHTRRGNFKGENRPDQDVPGHVRRSIYSKRLNRGQHRYVADADWGVLDGCTLALPSEYD